MKTIRITRIYAAVMALSLAALVVSCEDSSMGHGHMLHVEFSYTPTHTVVNTPISLLFEVEEDGNHASVDTPACEIHSVGEVTMTEVETGHYSGSHTFTQAGTYDVHFSFSFEGAAHEEKFTITVGP